MIALDEVGVISNLERPALEEWLNSEELHRIAGNRWLDADLPEFTSGSRAENINRLTAACRGCQRKGRRYEIQIAVTVSSLGLLAPLAMPVRAVAQETAKYTVLHIFTGPDGAVPNGSLISDDEGNLYRNHHRGRRHH